MATAGKSTSANDRQAAYFMQAQSWESTRAQQIQKSERRAWIVAGSAVAVAFAAVVAVAGLTPLKTTDLRVIRVDNSTGIVDVVNSLKDGKENYDEAVSKYFIQWYVRYREGYSKDLAEEYYYNTGLMSAGSEQQRYFEGFNPKNPRSPLNVYGAFAKAKVRVKSTSFINKNVALVRYTKEIERGTDKPQITHWAATIAFKYSAAPMSEKDRAINPLGLQVVEYRNDPDTGVDQSSTDTGSAIAPDATATTTVTLSPGERVEVPVVPPASNELGTGAVVVPAIR